MNAKTCKVLSIEAWSAGDGGWLWNMWYNAGTITLDIDSDEDAILAAMVDEGFIRQASSAEACLLYMAEDGKYSLAICDKGTGEPLFAIEYGSEEQ